MLWLFLATSLFFAGFAVGRRQEQRKLEDLVAVQRMLNDSLQRVAQSLATELNHGTDSPALSGKAKGHLKRHDESQH